MTEYTDTVMDFAPLDYKATEIPPDAPPGEWIALATVKKSKTKPKDDTTPSYPMLIINLKLEEAMEEKNEGSLGTRVSAFLTMFPEGHKANKMSKQNLAAVCRQFGIEVQPTGRIESWNDLQWLIDGIDGNRATIWTVNEKNDETDETFTRVLFNKPGAKAPSRKKATPDGDENVSKRRRKN